MIALAKQYERKLFVAFIEFLGDWLQFNDLPPTCRLVRVIVFKYVSTSRSCSRIFLNFAPQLNVPMLKEI